MPDPETLAILIPIVALLIPVVAILTKHQQRMAEIIHSRSAQESQAANAELNQLRYEVAQLREIVTSQALAVEQLRGENRVALQKPPTTGDELQNRING